MHQDPPVQDFTLSFAPYVPARFQALIWSCLDAELPKSAVFYAERFYSLDRTNHDARHLYATSLLRCGQVHSAMSLVNLAADQRCSGCAVIKAECCTILGRHAQAGEALEDCLSDPHNAFASASAAPMRAVRVFPEEAILLCRAGKAAMKENLHEKATLSFRHALALNPMLWEAFECLCAVGSFPEIEELFPSRPNPVKQGPEDFYANVASTSKLASAAGPVATGAGFFSPDVGAQNGVRNWKPDPSAHQPFRVGMSLGARESIVTNDSFFHPDNSMLGAPQRIARPPVPGAALPPRPLSSAEETGPAMKKPRSLSRNAVTENDKTKAGAGVESRLRKPVITSRSTKNDNPVAVQTLASRRSKRLLSGGVGERQKSHVVKHPPQRKRPVGHGRSKSTESEMEEDYAAFGDVARSPSPPSAAHSPRSECSPGPTWTAAQEEAAQEAYSIALADNYIFDLMRLFASAVRALAMYDCNACLEELDQLPEVHQRSSSVMAMVGRARYEMAEYMKAERFFHAARTLEPYRLWDMEVYSTTLWHLKRNVQLSFLAQELLSIDARSPQAWIAVGNCFSLQKERSQALTCFRRAAQLDPSCAYAYTLSGHESTDEDLDQAVTFFQSALRADPRHYNAWYGLGTCYLRMSKIRLAEFHFRKASSIHPLNAVLLGCVGMAVERRGERSEALALFNKAVELVPDNVLVRYRRAKILIAMKEYRAAVEDLERLRDSSPEEANIVFQLCRVYRLIGNQTKAAQMLAIARDMSPKSLSKIKRLLAIDADEGEDDMEEG